MKERRISDSRLFNEVVTGDVWSCPVCYRKFRLIHRAYQNRKKKYGHKLEEMKEAEK